MRINKSKAKGFGQKSDDEYLMQLITISRQVMEIAVGAHPAKPGSIGVDMHNESGEKVGFIFAVHYSHLNPGDENFNKLIRDVRSVLLEKSDTVNLN